MILREYDARFPIGDLRDDILAGTIAATIANIHRKRDVDPISPFDLVPFHAPPKVAPSVEDVARKLFAWGRSMGAEGIPPGR